MPLLCGVLVGVIDGFVEVISHADLARHVVVYPLRECTVGLSRVKSAEASVLHRQIVVFFFVHLLVLDILLGDPQ